MRLIWKMTNRIIGIFQYCSSLWVLILLPILILGFVCINWAVSFFFLNKYHFIFITIWYWISKYSRSCIKYRIVIIYDINARTKSKLKTKFHYPIFMGWFSAECENEWMLGYMLLLVVVVDGCGCGSGGGSVW